MIIPDYQIELLNKSKKIIEIVENINKIDQEKTRSKNKIEAKKAQPEKVISLPKSKKTKLIKKKIKSPRTLWVRRKKRA